MLISTQSLNVSLLGQREGKGKRNQGDRQQEKGYYAVHEGAFRVADPAFSFLTDSVAIDSGVWPVLSTRPDTTNHRSLELSVQVIRGGFLSKGPFRMASCKLRYVTQDTQR